MTVRRTRRGARKLILLLTTGLLLLAGGLPALASVTLTTFEATAREDSTIRVHWAAATELDTSAYRLYRSEAAQPESWGVAIHGVPARGSIAPADYEYIDSAVTRGVTYYYLLEDISTSNVVTRHGPVQARVLLSGETVTSTPTGTATRTSVPTATTGPGLTVAQPTPTATQPPPTATQRYTNTPVISPLGTPVLSAPTTAPIRPATAPPLPPAQLATPTGRPVIPTTAAISPEPTIAPVEPMPTLTPSAQVVAQAPNAGLTTATPRPTREVTPIIFSASETREGSTPAEASQAAVAGRGSRNMGLALTVGGAALGLAGLLAAVLLFIRSRKG